MGRITNFPEGWVAVRHVICSSAFCLVCSWQARGSPGWRWADTGIVMDASVTDRTGWSQTASGFSAGAGAVLALAASSGLT